MFQHRMTRVHGERHSALFGPRLAGTGMSYLLTACNSISPHKVKLNFHIRTPCED